MNQKFVMASIASAAVIAVGAYVGNQFLQSQDGDSTAQAMNHHSSMDHGQHGMNHGGMDHGGHGMHDMNVSSQAEFLREMIPHHQEAIDTAEIILARSQRPEMKAFAQEIIAVQSAEIEQMEAWLAAWHPNENQPSQYQPMMRDLTNLQGDRLDQVFLEDMIQHHMGAVMMSQQLLRKNLVENEPVKPFAEAIVSSQSQEIQQMHTWLNAWFSSSSGQPHH